MLRNALQPVVPHIVLMREGYVTIQFTELRNQLKMNCLEEPRNNRSNRNSYSVACTFESRTEFSLTRRNWVYSRPRPFMRGLVQRVCSSVCRLLQLCNAGDSRFRNCVAARVLFLNSM